MRDSLPREEVKTRLMLYGTKLFTIWSSGTETGGSIGVAWGKRNVHVTMWMKDDVLNCHITDDDQKVWERTMTLAELEAVVRKMQKKCLGRWSRNEKIVILNPAMLDAWTRNSTTDSKGSHIDLAGYIDTILPAFLDSNATPVRIRDALGTSVLFGLQRHWFDWYIVMAEPSGEILRWPIDINKGPLKKVVTIQGLRRYFKYIDKQGFFEYIAPSLDNEAIERLTAEIELTAARVVAADRQAIHDSVTDGNRPEELDKGGGG